MLLLFLLPAVRAVFPALLDAFHNPLCRWLPGTQVQMQAAVKV